MVALSPLEFLGALALAAGVIVAVYGLNLGHRWHNRGLPGPPPAWLFGNLLHLGQSGKSHEALQRWSQQYGPVYRYYLGRRPCVVLSDPELVRQACVKRFMDFHDRSLPVLEVGTSEETEFRNSGILFAQGKYWLGIRTACEPLFHSAALASYAPMMNAVTDAFVGRLQAAAGSGEAVNISKLLGALTMDTIGSTAFGVDFGAQKDGPRSELVEAAEVMFQPAGNMPMWSVLLTFGVPHLRSLWFCLALWFGSGNTQKTVTARRYLWGASQALLDSARKQAAAAAADAPAPTVAAGQPTDNGGSSAPAAALSQVQEQQRSVGSSGSKGGTAAEASSAFAQAYQEFAARVPPESSIVSRLKSAVNKQTGQRLTDMDICAQLFTFLLAGYETTSLALSYTLYELAKHPEMQQRIMQEVDAFGRQRPIAYADLAQFQYTEAAFLEAMRLYPPVSALIALVREPKRGGAELRLSTPGSSPSSNGKGSSGGGGGTGAGAAAASVRIPDGTRLMFNIWAIHRDPRHFPQPEEYRPDRFLPGSKEAASRHPDAFFPFGLGPRKCIGYKFAMEEAVLSLVRIFQRFELRLDAQRHAGPLDLHSGVTLMPAGGIWLKVHAREAA